MFGQLGLLDLGKKGRRLDGEAVSTFGVDKAVGDIILYSAQRQELTVIQLMNEL